MIRVLYLGAFSEAWNTECYVANALERAGCQVGRVEETGETCESLVRLVQEFEPDLFLFAKARFKEADIGWPEAAAPIAAMLQAIRPHVGRIVGWQFDLLAKEFAQGRYLWAELVAKECDIFAMTDGFTAPNFPTAAVLRQGVPDDVDQSCEWDVEPKGDVLFLGTAYRDRQDLRIALEQRFGGRFRHENQTRGAELTKLIRSYRICVGPHYPHYAGYWSNRIYVVTGHGGLFACPIVPGMEGDGWRAGQNFLALPDSPEAIADKLEEYLTKHDRHQLGSIRTAGYLHANHNCSYDARVRQLLAMVAAEPEEESEQPDIIATMPAGVKFIDGEVFLPGDEPEEPTELEGATPAEAAANRPAVALQVRGESDSGQSKAA